MSYLIAITSMFLISYLRQGTINNIIVFTRLLVGLLFLSLFSFICDFSKTTSPIFMKFGAHV